MPDDHAARRRRTVARVVKKSGAADLTVLKVNPTVWSEALRAADGDARRIEIRGEFDVVVHNEPLSPNERVNRTSTG